MAVYTSLSRIQIEQLLAPYELGEIKRYEGISDGIENTNYRIITPTADYILTIYEHFNAEEVPFYLQLLAFLRSHGIPVPEQVKNNHSTAQAPSQALGFWQKKPVAVFKCLPGHSLIKPAAHHCQQIGTALAQFHHIGQGFPITKQNAWGAGWLQSTGKTLLSRLAKDDARLLQDELLFQQQYVLSTAHQSLPQGIIHADLFRDNALFEHQQLSGILDFYTACNAPLIYDLAITINDWCLNEDDTGENYLNFTKSQALFTAYQQLRPITPEERLCWPPMLRTAALRFWLSRLVYAQSHKDAELTLDKDPDVLKCLLIQHRENINFCQSILST